MARIDDLIKQIQSQGTASKWSGGFGAEDATKDMARILDSIGISDIKQFGKVPTYKPVEIGGYKYNGQQVQQYRDEEGIERSYIKEPTGETTYNWETNENIPTMRTVGVPSDAKLEPIYGTREIIGYGDYGEAKTFFTPVKESDVITKDGQTVAKVGETFGNKETGQAVPNTYSERQTGNAFGGTFQGSGNTGYRVEFTPDGTPVFYTTGASSSDFKDFAPLLAVAGLAFGAPMLGELFGAGAAGAAGAGMTASELAALDLALGGAGGSLGAAELGAALAGGASGGAGLLESVFDPTFGGELSSVVNTGAVGGMTEAELAQLDMALGGSGGSAGATELGNALATGAPTATNTALTGGSGVFTGAAGGITPESVAAKLGDTAGAAAGATASKFPLSVSDTIRLAGIGTALAGGTKLAGDAMGSSGGYPIVPIPSDWTSPIKPTGVAEFTPLAPIDFGNKEMLRGTQWEQLLSPDYGKAPAMPSTPTNPSNMSFDQLMGVLGNTRTSTPTQSVSINDVIAGIQSQYGQTPTGSVG
jgi:hypothetical protein